MILYYALGGGLGHLSRSLALLRHAPADLQRQCRLLASSHSAELVRPALPCPLDLVPDWAMQEQSQYHAFLRTYLARYRFKALIVDSFPFGLVGELAQLGTKLPRILIGRALRWEPYCRVCPDPTAARWPERSLLIEEQPPDYLTALSHHSSCERLTGPVTLAAPASTADAEPLKPCCVVHSGSPEEVTRLLEHARSLLAAAGSPAEPELFTPNSGIFPMEERMLQYRQVVTGAGYASCAAAAALQGRVTFHQLAFERRYDDQQRRLAHLHSGRWGSNDPQAATATVAEALWGWLRSC